jgi:Tol biopolymer transport system component
VNDYEDDESILWLMALAAGSAWGQGQAQPVGIFEGHGDVGKVLHDGSSEYDAARHAYQLAGSGDNVWATADAFQYVWKKVSGDVSLTADITILGTGGNPHKKGMLMIRQSLDADSPYADAALHAVGLTSLQCRDEKGAATHEVQSNMTAPKRLRIVKRGDYFYMWVAAEGEQLHLSGGVMKFHMQEPFYIGIGVCAHDPAVVEKAVFSNVELIVSKPAAPRKTTLYSTIETVTVASTDAHVTYAGPGRIESANWTKDGASLLFTSDGRIRRVPVDGGKPEVVDTGSATHVNSFHGVSPDGTMLAFSDESGPGKRSQVYVGPVAGGAPKRIVEQGPAWWKAWSPDGKTILFTALRAGKTDIYSIPAAGGAETRLTNGQGLSDNPEFTPDGKFIYFNSDRSGSMQVWRMAADGSGPEQATPNGLSNWWPHLAPNGRTMVVLSYEGAGPPVDKDVALRIFNPANKNFTFLAKLVGGRGAIDAPCWAPDGRRLAFVSYQLLPEEKVAKK